MNMILVVEFYDYNYYFQDLAFGPTRDIIRKIINIYEGLLVIKLLHYYIAI